MLVLRFAGYLQSMGGTATAAVGSQRPRHRTESCKRNPNDADDARDAVR